MGRGRFRAAIALASAVTLLALLAAPATAEVYNGVDFPQGASSFADQVVSFTRGTRGTLGVEGNVLGIPDGPGGPLASHSLTLGNGGTLTIRFTDNVLTGSGDANADLFIFETGAAQEFVTVELSRNGSNFFSCGQTFGQTGAIDVDACGVAVGDQIFFVRITDIFDHRFASDSSAGADIDAIGAITTVQVMPPDAVDDAYSTDENEPLTIGAGAGLLANDTDPGGQDLTVVDVTQPAHGTVSVDPNGSFTYTPNDGFSGTDTFTYTIENEDGIPDTATVTITVDDVPPIARNDEYETDENTPLTVGEGQGLLANDDLGSGDFDIIDFTQPANGTVEVDLETGAFIYTPNPGFSGVDTFQYTAQDSGGSDPATVTIIVNPVNDNPNARNDQYATDENTELTVNPGNGVLSNDDDPDGGSLAVIDFTQPANGTVTVDSDGSFVYTPNQGFSGTDEFTYTIEDDSGQMSTATVRIDVAETGPPPNDPPNARDDEAKTEQGNPVRIPVLDNDDDPDGDRLTVIDVSRPDHGHVEINNDGTITYIPDDGFSGTDSFTYTIDDGNGGTRTARVTVEVTEKNQAPETKDDDYDVKPDEPTHIDNEKGVLDNDEDPDGDKLEAKVEKQPAHGQVDMNDNGAFTYTPDAGFRGKDEFVYLAKDGHGNDRRGSVRLRVGEGRVDEPGEAYAGDGGVSTADASGGAVVVGDENSGGNVGDLVTVQTDAPPAEIVAPVETAAPAVVEAAQGLSDDDGDGLTFEDELKAYGTDPLLWDSDGDGVSDGVEVLQAGTNPLAPEQVAVPETAPVVAAPVVAETIVEPAVVEAPGVDAAALPSGEAVAEPVAAVPAPVAAPAAGCAGFQAWLDAQTAYETAGSLAADPALVAQFDPDYDGIACEEMMAP